MKANELRIGNWVLSKSNDWVKVESILSSTFRVFGHYGGDDGEEYLADFLITDLSPIPLTPEILEKAGLTAKESDNISDHYHFNLLNSSVSFFICCSENGIQYGNDGYMLVLVDGVPMSRIPCEYLHQLQNIIHALTGEELNIQL